MSEFSELLTVKQVASRLALSRTTVYSLMDSGRLAYVKFGRARRIPADEVAALVERSHVGNSADMAAP